MELRHGRDAVEAHLEDTGLAMWVCCHGNCTLHLVYILLCGCLHSNNPVLPQQYIALQQWPSSPALAIALYAKAETLCTLRGTLDAMPGSKMQRIQQRQVKSDLDMCS